MALADDFRARLRGLPDDWAEARFVLRTGDADRAARAAALLGGIGAARRGETVHFSLEHRGGSGPDLVALALRRLDREKIDAELELVASRAADPAPETRRPALAQAWDEALANLPPDWSDIYAEIELTSTDYLEPAALLLAPVNPARHGDRPVLRFRCAHSFGYGAAPEMVRRCLERLDEAGIRGEVRILHALSDTKPWATQGPVWYLGGKPV